jgi:hypothetical protein
VPKYMNQSDAVEILKNFCNRRVLVCEQTPISPTGLRGLAVEQIGTTTITAQGSSSGVQIAEGIQ